MMSNIDLPDTSNQKTEEKNLTSIFSPTGNYLSPASLDGRTPSITGGNSSSSTGNNHSNNNNNNNNNNYSNNGSLTSNTDNNRNFRNQNPINLPSPLSFLNGSLNQLGLHKNMTTTSPSVILLNSSNTSTPNSNTGNTPSHELNKIKEDTSLKPDISVSSTVKDQKGHVVKRKYSRNGCTECKRRRMKCDETKPTCWQCARLNRTCVYVLNPRNKKRKDQNSTGSESHPESSGQSPENILASQNDNSQVLNPSSRGPSLIENMSGDTQTNPLNMNQCDDHIPDVTSEVANSAPIIGVDGIDTNLLMQNLNDIVNMKLNDATMINENMKDLDFPELDIPELLMPSSNHHSSVPISFLMNNVIQFNIKITSFKLGGMHDEYLRIFYNDCLDSIAPFFQNQGNPLRDILLSFARNESYLLSAILAVGASISHRATNKSEDERNYCAYLSHCLSLLGDQFHNEANVLNKIEPIILTVMLLAWDCINTMNSQWRSHLKGVTDLFAKINAGNSSKVLNVAKCWFKVIETFASISTGLGGSLFDEDLDIIFNPYDYQYVDSLKFLNVMTPLNEFNLLRGHKEDFDLVIREVLRGLNYVRRCRQGTNATRKEKEAASKSIDLLNFGLSYLKYSESTKANNDESNQLNFFKTQKILVEIDRQLEYEFINKTGIIPRESQSHPDNSHIDDNAIDMVKLRNGETIAISWYDISHQTQVLCFLLIVLLNFLGLPKESILIQQVIKRLMSFFKFLDSDNPPHNARTCYSNFAVLYAGLHAVDEETRDMVRRYYEINGDTSKRLTDYNLHRLEKVWYGKESNDNLENQDVLTW
ncbi:similar to Saccharomyces cerevisiae YDR034C LYS14 Transcriptional activator involved in regulation of genes of the lysine biosynthesis pathway [Maudiozyma barnettii]|uniref:Similar to Saccharomyces cerevisiae YDR034C LYS14 Transcriptional activator involved in regulation of genes of the lysine biosynthesis pathway n=1 Tax=Maudiozyma barnettii TaxID=61262 RepID=A0A8H2ZGW0_9SACH|nr:Lys14p [Kazachstania barnettii]CAB4253130.1 similar to Saccharomyces cerevisiae YDR034C LYS14 Transcriptional activator involved in regulation of genes of the lysine biosynthesis pathway [Kazachstania barnettii]CAD1780334.1 similar to Saccharomyces cerevisiae YDR034C LYS14 Transcriptional activator involved in regulation of genes of the lysine biosynthesis pathway [Kazachstania barnettii]